MINRFLLFAGTTFYPCGGWNDFIASFETLHDALQLIVDERPETKKRIATADYSFDDKLDKRIEPNIRAVTWAHIIDIQSGQKAWSKNDFEFYIMRPKRKKS